ncbi:hypothetical protein F503_02927 [Ophiostoma piceae UAMH 11346]|uniref:Uncharacterized protein n=1 Tax=Ophiostoma piceae (strain UAMH 11346) TaxID=1262450 RepID=S3CIA0_OPHP1|nr:hypothetical protein F503_02927 [Ophiostoma piceae UAMH 11346]
MRRQGQHVLQPDRGIAGAARLSVSCPVRSEHGTCGYVVPGFNFCPQPLARNRESGALVGHSDIMQPRLACEKLPDELGTRDAGSHFPQRPLSFPALWPTRFSPPVFSRSLNQLASPR